MQNTLAPYPSNQIQRKEPKSYSRLKGMTSNVLEDQQQHSLTAQNQTGQVKDRANRVAPVKNKGDVKKEIANSGRKVRAQEAHIVWLSTMTNVEERERRHVKITA